MVDMTFNIAALGDAFTKIVALGDSVERVGKKLDELDVKRADPKVNVDTTEATAKIDELDRKIKAAGSGGGAGAGIGQGAAIAGAVALGLGPLAGAGLLAIPAAIAAIGIAATKSNVDVQAAFKGFTTAAKSSVTDGFSPFVPTIVGIADQAKSTIVGLEPAFAQAATDAGPLLQVVSTGLLKATSAGVTGTLPLLKTLGPVAQALADDFGKAEQGAIGFLSHLDVGAAASGLNILGTDLQQILPAVGSLVSEVMPLANAILSDLGPALRNTASDLGILTPLLNAAGAVISFLGPDISTLGPPLLAVMGITKLMTGSWVDFSGLLGKAKPLVTDFRGTLDSLGQTIGITSKATNQAAAAEAASALTKAELIKVTRQQAVAEAEAAFAADASAKNSLALIAAQDAEAVSAKAAAAAEEALAATTEAASFSFGPLGIALGGLALLALPFIGSLTSSTDAASKLTGELGNLQQAATSASSLAHLFQTDPNAQSQLNLLQKYGVTLRDLADAQNGDIRAQQKIADAAKQASDAINAKTDADQKQLDALHSQDASSGKAAQSSKQNAGAIVEATDKVNADKQAREQANQTYRDAKAQLDATTQAQAAMSETTAQSTAVTDQAAQMASALGIDLGSVTTAFRNQAAGTTYAMSEMQKWSDGVLTATLAVDSANNTVTNYFKQADQAASQAAQSVADANHSVAQSITAVADANHAAAQSDLAVVTARQGVVLAERAVGDAMANVVIAQNNETKAVVAAQQAQVNLNAARQTEIEQLKSLHLQLADQVTSEESARIALIDQTRTSAGLGVTPDNAAAIAAIANTPGGVTATNESKINAAIALVKAQDALNNVLNTGENLRAQVNAADKAGVDGAPSVISAQQALASAQDQVVSATQATVKARQAVTDAQANVLKSEQAVKDALYAEGKAHDAVKDALYNKQKAMQAVGNAQQALSVAQDNASRSMDINTQAGQRNIAMMQKMAEQLFANENPQQAGNDLINNTAQLFQITTQKAQDYLTKLGLIPANFKFSLTAVAGANLDELNKDYNTSLGHAARGMAALPFADGGMIRGPGTGTSDSIPAITNSGGLLRVSDGEYIVNAIGTRKNLRLLEAINSGKGFASGGLIDPIVQAISLAATGGIYQTGVDTLTALGFPAPPGLPVYVPPALPTGGGSMAASSASAAHAQAYAMSRLGVFGWGPDQMTPLIKLWNQESGWNPWAVNPSSGAYGIPQSLGHGHPYDLGDDVAQINWGLPYIGVRYGSPAAAWAHEQAFNWYRDGGVIDALRAPKVRDNGGPIDPGWNMIYNGTGRAETSRSGTQEDALLAELRSLRRDIKSMAPVTVNAGPGMSESQLADDVVRRLNFHRGR
jgi:hypothetical protein